MTKKKTLSFAKEQVTQVVSDLKESGQDHSALLKVFLEAMMRAEHEEYKQSESDCSYGYRSHKAFASGRVVAKKVPRTKRKQLMWEVKDFFQDRTRIHNSQSSYKRFVADCERWAKHYKSFEYLARDIRFTLLS